jgi:hypothetical protein
MHFTFDLSHLPLLKFRLLLRFDFWANGDLFGWQHGEHPWWKCGCRVRPARWALVASANLGSSHRINPRVKGWADRVVVSPRDQFSLWWHYGWQCLRSSTKLLCGITGHPTTNLHWSKRATGSRPLAPHHWIQVRPPQLYWKSEDHVHSSVIARQCQSMSG